MKALDSVTKQRQKESKRLKIFLLSSLIGSLAMHSAALTLQVINVWNPVPETLEAETEIVVEAIPPEPIKEDLLTEVEPPPEPEMQATLAPELAAPVPLAPETQAPAEKGQDAPSQEPPSSTTDPIAPLTNQDGETQVSKPGAGPITSPDGNGQGFGRANQSTGFVPGGKPDGKPDGKPGGTGVQTNPGKPAGGKKPVCLSCPKPKYQGVEGSPRVDMEIQPDGSVRVRLRKSSGNPETDREALETMSKWRFDPQTVPEGGVRKRVRVTFEESGSTYQRQNEQRRQQQAESRQRTEQERQIPEAAVRDRPNEIEPNRPTPKEPSPQPQMALPSFQPQSAEPSPANPGTPVPALSPVPAETPGD